VFFFLSHNTYMCTCIGLLKDVRQLTASQLEEVKYHLTRPHLEVACTLVYSDLSTQLRNRKVFNHFNANPIPLYEFYYAKNSTFL
jgi:hypothetical protein